MNRVPPPSMVTIVGAFAVIALAPVLTGHTWAGGLAALIAVGGWALARHLDASADDVASTADDDRVAGGGDVASVAADPPSPPIVHRATHDEVTGLANRTLLLADLAQRAREAGGATLLVADLTRFREVNDALGHDWGDRLLRSCAAELLEVSGPGALVSRLSGDEFAISTIELEVGPASVLAERMREVLRTKVSVDGIGLPGAASIGIARYPWDASTPDMLVRRATAAMYAAKNTSAGWALYAPSQDSSSVERLRLLGDVRNAVDEGQLVLEYQPAVEVATGAISSVEALVRWQHPEHGLIDPGRFIELAVAAGAIKEVSNWVLAQGVATLGQLRVRQPDIAMSINLSVLDLDDRSLAPWIALMLDEAAVPAEALVVEVTETELIRDPETVAACVRSLADAGVQVAIDDFGAGYTSLALLRDLPVSELKIDRSFVTDAVADSDKRAIVRSLIDLGRSLDIRVVAEGVEDQATLDLLADLGCTRVQGYFLYRPVPAPALPIG